MWTLPLWSHYFGELDIKCETRYNISIDVSVQNMPIGQCHKDYNIINDLTPCQDLNNQAGLGLSNHSSFCLNYLFWCSFGDDNGKEYINIGCPSFKKLIGNKEFCQNVTFWKDRPCDNKDEYVRGIGKFIGKCISKNCSCEDPSDLSLCPDKSQHICPVESKYCKQNETWTCNDNTTCISEALVCDGFQHCPDGSDETAVNFSKTKLAFMHDN